MSPSLLSLVFVAALLASLLVKLWLATRQIRHVSTHRDAVPAPFAERVTLEAHRKAADYTVAKLRFGLLTMAFGTVVLVGWTLLGGLDALNGAVREAVQPRWGTLAYEVALVIAFSLIGALLDLPFEAYATFRLEQRFGYNRITPRLFVLDLLRNTAIGLALGVPILALVFWLMSVAGTLWWLWAWFAWAGYALLMQVVYPLVIAPLYNKFEPLADETLDARVRALMSRCGFALKGLFVMDGSKRSAHSNAYFTGIGASKRVVFYDTLVRQLTPPELEAVLAHELGHFKLKHVQKGMVLMFALSLAGLALLGWVSTQAWFYLAFGVQPSMQSSNNAVALILLALVVPVFGFFVQPLLARFSRKHEFEADAYACAKADGRELAAALLKLHQDNASTLTPDPLYVRFYYSHPPASERLAALPQSPTPQAG
ncbi:MAG TPA: M48 family metallopeptidase [Albitalea sp.]|nr:M48 family metallopeptidase [Albitalea sp.]